MAVAGSVWLLAGCGAFGTGHGGEGEQDGEPPSATSAAPSKGSKGDKGSNGDDKGRESGNGGKGGKGAHKPADAPLRGKVIVVDPGHNPHNRDQPGKISRLVDIGTGKKECDTTGTSTNSGYAEAEFTLDLAHRVRTQLRERGATVKFTHDGDEPYGPCVDERARKGNRAQADAAISLHADGAPSGSRGFHVILPASVHKGEADTRKIVGPSRELGTEVRDAFREATDEPPANYLGDGNGLDTRGDLGGLNLSKVPKVFLECGNMRDPADAALLTSAKWREKAARGVTDGIAAFLS
ncbi:N-acetylmuramoyl-L-alanine amidase [Streptomyces spirodelae]|uniref:N-acetylmuramoyl-L-alanine amidase n=1 Tax=Streptomyces spirodelae TaxID=2812904 RepID=A0ABS3WN31_9ACTN|nr:N-acetylmuramoyl-L-alanine amidase [Streptomyces spirodelae]MBO8184538.1 N-acetylmuramoyl-L-alanine amidase [Streptomyces spirodelae]